MFVVFFTEGRYVPARRFRVEHFFGLLKKEGIRYFELPSWPSKYFNITCCDIKALAIVLFGVLSLVKAIVRVFQLPLVLFADVVFIQRELLPYNIIFLEHLVRLFNKNIVFDFDDSIFLYKDEISSSIGKYLTKKDTIAETIRMSREVICGNGYLAEYAKKYNKNVTIIPTVLDTDKYVPKNQSARTKGRFVIGWMGTSGNLKYLLSLKEVFREIQKMYPEVILRIITEKFLFEEEFSDAIPTEFKKWSEKNEVSDLQGFDLGVMPLADNKWTKGKCGFKILQYMATGIPVIASSVGANNEIVQDGISGFLASNDIEWKEKISKIIQNDSDIVGFLSKKGRERVVNHYSIRAVFPVWSGIIRRAAGRTKH